LFVKRSFLALDMYATHEMVFQNIVLSPTWRTWIWQIERDVGFI
jgi:hypothetical protein